MFLLAGLLNAAKQQQMIFCDVESNMVWFMCDFDQSLCTCIWQSRRIWSGYWFRDIKIPASKYETEGVAQSEREKLVVQRVLRAGSR